MRVAYECVKRGDEGVIMICLWDVITCHFEIERRIKNNQLKEMAIYWLYVSCLQFFLDVEDNGDDAGNPLIHNATAAAAL